MYQDGTRVVLLDGREGVIEVSSPDDWAYHVRLDSGTVVQVPENWIAPVDAHEVCHTCKTPKERADFSLSGSIEMCNDCFNTKYGD